MAELTILDAMEDPELFGAWFAEPSWDAWRAFLAAVFGLPMSEAHDHAAAAAPATLMTGLGAHHHAIVTKSPAAQRFFDQGLTLLYGFNHGQAIRQFQRSSRPVAVGRCARTARAQRKIAGKSNANTCVYVA